MANPLPNEEKVYEKIEKEHICVHPIVWELINHHIRNDLNYISVCMGLLCLTPSWILKSAFFLINFLLKICGKPTVPDFAKIFEGVIERVGLIDKFLRNLQEKTLK